MFSRPFLRSLAQLLKPSGFFSYKTDHAARFAEVSGLLPEVPELQLRRTTEDLYSSPYIQENVPTEFEQLFQKQGLPIFHLLAAPRG